VDGSDSHQQIATGVRLDHIAMRPDTQGVFCCLDRIVLADKYDSRIRRNHAYLACGLDAADAREANVQENDSGMKFFGFFDGFFPVSRLAYDIKTGLAGKDGSNTPARYFMIVDQ
jgi:hypothetical protein